MTYLLFTDTETTGLLNQVQPMTHPSQPRLVNLACLMTTEAGHIVSSVDLIVKPEGWIIPDHAARIHGITTDIALALGVPAQLVVACYTNLRASADVLVGHNWHFDRNIMDAAIFRTGRKASHPGPADYVCTMQMATRVLGLDAGLSLVKLTRLLFNEELRGAHTAFADVHATARAYFELKRREALLSPPAPAPASPPAEEPPF